MNAPSPSSAAGRRCQIIPAFAAVGGMMLAAVAPGLLRAQEKPPLTEAYVEYLQALNLAMDGSQAEALRLLAQSMRHQPQNNPAAALAFELLTERRSNSSFQLRGHTGSVLYAAYSPDGSKIVTASSDHTARLWDANTGQPLGQPITSKDDMAMAEFSPDGTRIVTASEDRTARVWDVATGQEIGSPMTDAHEMRFARFSPDGTLVSTGAEEGTGRVWNAQTGEPVIPPLRGHGDVFSINFSPDGTRIVTATADAKSDVIDLRTGKPAIPSLKMHNNVFSAVFSPDGSKILTASADHTAQIWDAATGEVGGPIFWHGAFVYSAYYNAEASRVLTASGDHTARVWNAANGEPITPPLQHGNEVNNAIFSPDGKIVATGSLDHHARLWDANTGMALSLPLDAEAVVTHIAIRPNGATLMVASDDHVVHFWDLPPSTPAPAWLADLAEFASNQTQYDALRSPAMSLVNPVRKELLSSTSDDPWERFGRWYFQEPEDRTVSPRSTASLKDYVEALAARGDHDSLDYAISLSSKVGPWLDKLTKLRSALGEKPAPKPAAKDDDD